MSKDNKLTSPKRERVSINFLGVDNSSPDISVKDGAMAEMSNVRYNDDAWRPVHMFDKVGDIPDGYRAVYHHPAAGDKVYVITDDSATFYSYDLESETQTIIADIKEAVKDIKHFGNVLIFIGRDNSVEYYVLQDGKYYRFEKPTAPTAMVEEIAYTPAIINYEASRLGDNGSLSPVEEDEADIHYGVWALYDEAGNSVYPASKDNKWWGEIAFFTAYRMNDGSVISPSPIGIISSETEVALADTISNYKMLWRKFKDGDDAFYGIAHYATTAVNYKADKFRCPQMHYVSPQIRVSIPSKLSTLIESVAVFATRIFSPFKWTTENSKSATFADNKLPEQTFYLLKDVPLRDFTNGECVVDVNYDSLKSIEQNLRYEPNNNIHHISFASALDYNHRLHIADITTYLHDMEEMIDYVDAGDSENLYNATIQAMLSIDNASYRTNMVSKTSTNDVGLFFTNAYQNILSYHDYRCEEVRMFYDNSHNATSRNISMIPATNNNVAYSIIENSVEPFSYTVLHYPALPFIAITRQGFTESLPVSESSDVVTQHNKVMLSQTNNPFAFNFANTYAFGSADNKVLAMQSAAVEMSDAKFGEYPLFVFTESGIFGLQSGAESVYSNVVPINYDRIINPRTLAINYNVVYITHKGIHLLNGNGTTLISQPIDTMLGYPDVEKFQRLYPLRSTQYNEIAFVVDSIAYVYSLINGVWSTRSFDMTPISQEEAYRYNEVFNIINENTSLPARCVIASRPIKLGSVEYKRLETFIPRFANLAETENMTITITIEGSNDCKEWKELRKVDAQGYKVIRRTPQSCKYFRFFLEFIDVEEFTFSNVDLEYYVKFLRRMR